MITVLLFDLSRVFLFPKNKNYQGELNALHRSLADNPDYNFSDYFEFNEELLDIAEKLKAKTDLYMFTSGTIQETREVRDKIKGLFKEIFSAEKLGLSKVDPQVYLEIAKKIEKPKEEIILIDDSEKNILAAKETNLTAILFTNNFRLIEKLRKYINFTL